MHSAHGPKNLLNSIEKKTKEWSKKKRRTEPQYVVVVAKKTAIAISKSFLSLKNCKDFFF